MSNVGSLDGMVRVVVENAIRNGDFDEMLRLRAQRMRFQMVPVANGGDIQEEQNVPAPEHGIITKLKNVSARTTVDGTVTVAEAAKMANVTIKAVYNALQSKKLRGKKIQAPEGVQRRGPHGGRITVIPVDSIKRWADTVRR